MKIWTRRNRRNRSKFLKSELKERFIARRYQYKRRTQQRSDSTNVGRNKGRTVVQTSDATKVGQHKRRTQQRSNCSTNFGRNKGRIVQTSDATKVGQYKRRTCKRRTSTNVGLNIPINRTF